MALPGDEALLPALGRFLVGRHAGHQFLSPASVKEVAVPTTYSSTPETNPEDQNLCANGRDLLRYDQEEGCADPDQMLVAEARLSEAENILGEDRSQHCHSCSLTHLSLSFLICGIRWCLCLLSGFLCR